MKNLKTKISKIIIATLFCAVFTASPEFLRAQNKRLYGELTIIKSSSAAISGDAYITIDGVRAASGRSVSSPSDIETPTDASAKISFAQTGVVLLAPNSKIGLTFVNSSIAGDLAAGEITVETVPNTTINIFTRDGAITTPNRSEKTIVKISILNGATRVDVSSGQIMFNKVLVSAGEFYPQKLNTADVDSSSSNGVRPIVIIAILGAVAAAALIALSVSSGNNDNPTVSPTR